MTRKLLAALLFVAGCSAAYADQVAAAPPAPQARVAIAIASAPDKIRAPYDVQIIRDNGEVLPTYTAKDRFYVQGSAGERYILRITNPTPNRVEAVVTVDGLDVIDGEGGDLHKRGYVVPAYGETRIEGFRTSQQDVATFRFSAVDDSYAGKQGKARNVGVVAVAIFEETARQQIIEQGPPPPSVYDYEDDVTDGRGGANRDAGKGGDKDVATRSKKKRVADADAGDDAVASRRRPSPPPQKAPAPAAPATSPVGPGASDGAVGGYYEPPPAAPPPLRDYHHMQHEERDDDSRDTARTNRPGLGTEYGEQRYSATSFTRFERATDRPIAIAELRYNDTAGLMALGIQVQPMPDEGEIMTRETADPFPGDRGYARPPR